MSEDKNMEFDGLDEEFDTTITLTDEDGEEVNFEFLDLVEYEGKEYVVLLPMDADEDDGEVVILEVLEDPEDPESENYVGVDDENILGAVFDIFKEKFKDEFDFTE